MQRARGAYFVNRHGTFWKEGNFNFPEHPKFLKSIKNSLRKSKKPEIFLKILRFFRKSENFRFFSKKSIENRIEKHRDFRKFSRFRKKSQNFENFSDFFDFLVDFFMNFKKF